ncbi:MAG: phenylalanine--tRNA ligase subunit alpha [Alphaproteobacteria bacterium GM7ARS4]|nr:phenylalanine--tRNA ligase subunit alpha [Alphaproteobacteria bacterium GM7ARS4]
MAGDKDRIQRDVVLEALHRVGGKEELAAWYRDVLGKKGSLTLALRSLGSLDKPLRRERGKELNALRRMLEGRYEQLLKRMSPGEAVERSVRGKEGNDRQDDVDGEDWSLPVSGDGCGRLHPIPYVMEEITSFFGACGFVMAQGPHVEDDDHNFEALNMPPHHPARQMHDTFYLSSDESGASRLLRTHTSSVQIRAMRAGTPPFYVMASGGTYRRDYDQTHTPMFHQIEGLAVDKDIHMGHLKGCLQHFCEEFFGYGDVPLRFRPSFFPFTEPSAEVDIACHMDGESLSVGGESWMEILGCGMVHPHVLEACGVDSGCWQGFAFGMGVERLAMLKYGMRDVRMFFESEHGWLRHYGFRPFSVVSP